MKLKLILSATMLTATAAAMVTPANASLSDCNSGHMCIWGNNDYLWMLSERTGGSSTITNLTGDNNNQNDSWSNKNSTYKGAAYNGANGTGECTTMPESTNVSNIPFYDADDWSSWRTKFGC